MYVIEGSCAAVISSSSDGNCTRVSNEMFALNEAVQLISSTKLGEFQTSFINVKDGALSFTFQA
jgi:hypothetical protein